jgi:uncharacterized protein (UPF0548 family)
MFLLRRPQSTRLAQILMSVRAQALSYEPIGIARGTAPRGFRAAEEIAVLGHGRDVFVRAAHALGRWRQFDLGWAGVYPTDAPVTPGTDVLVIARHLGCWSVNACRVLYLLGDHGGAAAAADTSAAIAGFAYGTLAEHAEVGEETFEVSLNPASGEVIYRVRAVSRERAALARLGFPVARALQRRFRRDSAAALRRAVADVHRA